MACSPTATKTEYATVANSSTLTTFTDSVETVRPLITTLTSQTCSETVLDSGRRTCIERDTTVVTTIAGGLTTVQVPIVVVYEITQVSPTKTLYASCSNSANGQTGSPVTPSSSSSPSSPSSSSLTESLITPVPSVIVTQVPSTRADGSVVLETMTFTSTFAPVSVLVPIQTTSSSVGNYLSHSSNSKLIIGPIVGGILGGFFGLIGVVFLIWYLWRRRSRLFARSPPTEPPPMSVRPKYNPGFIVEPQDYSYGALGSINSYGTSPPTSTRHRSSMNSLGPNSPRLSFSQGNSPTPPFFPSTTMLPGQSQPSLSRPSTGTQLGQSSSRPPTPGHFFPQAPPSAFPSRQTWSVCGTDDERSSSEGHGSITFAPTIKPQSRTSLTMERKGRPPSSRKSFSGTIDLEPPVRSAEMRRRSTDATPQLEDMPTPLFVVNHSAEASSGSSTVGPG